MQNAKIEDCNGREKYNVMYLVEHPWYGSLLAHIKGKTFFNGEDAFMMETAEGCPILAMTDWLKPVLLKEGSKPKAKRKPQKGSKPWLAKYEYVDYDPSLIKPGTKVKCRDKKIRTVRGLVEDYAIEFEDEYWVALSNGKECGSANKWNSPYDIMKIVVEKQQMFLLVQNSKHNGYAPNVWHFWQGGECPVDGDVKVEYWLRENTIPCREIPRANDLYWEWRDNSYDIIAFRIVE